ncbi:MAG: hypothetical protein NXI24_21755 [bacterium]|nr:hypothetical protein [bacterium]
MNPELEANARRLIAIARENGSSEARALLMAAMHENPFISKLAPEILDTPAFLFRELDAQDLTRLIAKLDDGVLRAIAGETEDLREVLKRNVSDTRWQAIKSAEPVADANQRMFSTLGSLIAAGKISFDHGLLFQTLLPCLPASTADAGWRILATEACMEQTTAAELLIFGPPRASATFTLQLGSIVLIRETVYTDHDGFARVAFLAAERMQLLAERDRHRTKILLACLRNDAMDDSAYLALRPLVFEDDFALSDGDRPLELFISYLEAKDETLLVQALLLDRDQEYRGAGEFTLRCACCAASVGTAARPASAPQDLQFATRDHRGPFLLTFCASGSGRRVSVDLGTPAANPILRKPAATDGLKMQQSFRSDESIQVEFAADGLVLYSLAPAAARHLLRSPLDDLATAVAFGNSQAEALTRASRFIIERVGRTPGVRWHEASQSERTISVAEHLAPGNYAIEYARISAGEIIDRGRHEFEVRPTLQILVPARIHPDDDIKAEVLIPAPTEGRILDAAGQEIESNHQNLFVRFQLPLNPSQLNYVLEETTNGQLDKRQLETAILDHRPPTPTHVLKPVAALGQSASPGENPVVERTLDQAIQQIAWNLWNYNMDCAEQISSKLFAYAVLQSGDRKNDLGRQDHDELVLKIRDFYDPESGWFSIWHGQPPDARTTSRVLRSLAVFRGGKHPLAQLVETSINRLRGRGQKDDSLAFLDSCFASSEATILSSAWEKIWRGPPELTGEFRERHLNGILRGGNGLNRKDAWAFWSVGEISAIAYWAGSLLGEKSLIAKRERSVALPQSFWQRVLRIVGLGGPTTRKKTEELQIKNPAWDPESFADRFIYQGGVPLYGSTTGTVFLIQALLSLRRHALASSLLFTEVSPRATKSPRIKTASRRPDVHWRIPKSVFQGKSYRVSVRVDSQDLRRTGILSVYCPAHSRVSNSEPETFARARRFIQIPLQGRTEVSVHLQADLCGTARASMEVHSMYDATDSASHSAIVQVK